MKKEEKNYDRDILALEDSVASLNYEIKNLNIEIAKLNKEVNILHVSTMRLENPPKFNVGEEVVSYISVDLYQTYKVIGVFYLDGEIVPRYRLVNQHGEYEERYESTLAPKPHKTTTK